MKLNEVAKIIMEGVRPKIGDIVQFTLNGKRWEGTVADFGSTTPGKIKLKKFAHFGAVATPIETVRVAIRDKGLAVISASMITKIVGRGDAAWARSYVASIKDSHKDYEAKRKSANRSAAEDGGLSNLKPGDPIKVEYSGGDFRERKFLRFTASGSVVYDQNGRERKTSAQYVKLP